MSFFKIKSAYLIALLYSLLPPVVLHEGSLRDMITGLKKGGLGLGAKWSSRVFLSLRRCLAVSLYQFQEISQISLKLFRESLLFLSVMPNEKRARQQACLSSEDERTPPHNRT